MTQEATKNVRDTQFAGCAKLLRQEIFKQLAFLDFQFAPRQQASIDCAIEKIVDRRLYDFACHVAVQTILIAHGNMAEVPDLTKWPEEDE